jgi:hypothetical protein
MLFIGLDLTDPFAKRKRFCTRAVLDSRLRLVLDEWEYQENGTGIIPSTVKPPFVLAIDGPQGLAGAPDSKMRICERALGAAGKSPYEFPIMGRPFAGFVIGSVKLFEQLSHNRKFNLLGMQGNPQTINLIEVYPGAAWPLLAGHQHLPKKTSLQGRADRYEILLKLGVRFLPDFSLQTLPTHDHLDAALAAYIGYLFTNERVDYKGVAPFEDMIKSVLREGFIIQPTEEGFLTERPFS